MKKGSLLYTAYVVTVFMLTATIFIPMMALLAPNKNWHKFSLRLHNIWAKSFFLLAMIRVKIINKDLLEADKQYIFCMNHFSFLDIPTFYLVHRAKFLGKSSLTRIPLFGYFFQKIHIPVNRSSSKSRAESLAKTKQALDEGFNVAIFPEGGIWANYEDLPYMVPFKDGAFKLAVEKNLPIVPVVMPTNFEILPDSKPLRFYNRKCIIHVLPPILPGSNNALELNRLKSETFNALQSELLRYHPNKVTALG